MASVILGLSRNFYAPTHVNFTRVNKIEAMYGRSRVSMKVERGLTFTFTRGLSYIASISFMHVRLTCVGTEKLRNIANQPLLSRARRKTQSNTKRERRAQCARQTKGKVASYRVFIRAFLSYLSFLCFNLAPTVHAGVWYFNLRSRLSSLQSRRFFFFKKGAT